MDSPSQVLMLLTIFMLLLFHSNAANPHSKLVQEFCSEINTPANCLSALELDPRTTTVSKLRNLTQIVLEVAIANTTASQTYIKNINTNNTTPAFKDAINHCVSNSSYGYSIGLFSMAIEELDSDLYEAGVDATVAVDGATRCKEAWKKVGIIPPSISIRNSYLDFYSYLADKIITKLSLVDSGTRNGYSHWVTQLLE